MSLSKEDVKKHCLEREGRLFVAKNFYLNADGTEYLTIGICPEHLSQTHVQVHNRVTSHYVIIKGEIFAEFVAGMEHCMEGKSYDWGSDYECDVKISSTDKHNISIDNRDCTVTLSRESCLRIVEHGDLIVRDITVNYAKIDFETIVNEFEDRVADLGPEDTVNYLKTSIAKRHPTNPDHTVLTELVYNYDYLMTLPRYKDSFFGANDTDTE